MTTDTIFNIDLDDFEEKVLTASHDTPVLVDFWAEWCSPCLFIAPVLKQVLEQYEGKVLLAKLEVDEGENMRLAGKYQVRGFPTIILFEEGQEVERFSSARPASFIKEFIESNSRILEL
ncbi:MAG: thioredoxin fold domain-containing protein [Cocleimonas sp.]|nr:thioredoxin fold domain-containing protein [Cocleimonas sp.]